MKKKALLLNVFIAVCSLIFVEVSGMSLKKAVQDLSKNFDVVSQSLNVSGKSLDRGGDPSSSSEVRKPMLTVEVYAQIKLFYAPAKTFVDNVLKDSEVSATINDSLKAVEPIKILTVSNVDSQDQRDIAKAIQAYYNATNPNFPAMLSDYVMVGKDVTLKDSNVGSKLFMSLSMLQRGVLTDEAKNAMVKSLGKSSRMRFHETPRFLIANFENRLEENFFTKISPLQVPVTLSVKIKSQDDKGESVTYILRDKIKEPIRKMVVSFPEHEIGHASTKSPDKAAAEEKEERKPSSPEGKANGKITGIRVSIDVHDSIQKGLGNYVECLFSKLRETYDELGYTFHGVSSAPIPVLEVKEVGIPFAHKDKVLSALREFFHNITPETINKKTKFFVTSKYNLGAEYVTLRLLDGGKKINAMLDLLSHDDRESAKESLRKKLTIQNSNDIQILSSLSKTIAEFDAPIATQIFEETGKECDPLQIPVDKLRITLSLSSEEEGILGTISEDYLLQKNGQFFDQNSNKINI